MEKLEVKTKYGGMHRRIILEVNRAYRVVPLNERKTKHRDRECVLIDIVPVSASKPQDKVAKVRFSSDHRLGRIALGDLLPLGELYGTEYTEDDPEHRPEDYGWDELDLPEAMLQDMVRRAKAGMPLTNEQADAIRYKWRGLSGSTNFVPLPSNPKKITKEQSQAIFGGAERTKLAGTWFQLEIMSSVLNEHLKKGETEWVNEDGSRVPITQLLATIEPMRERAHLELAEYDRQRRS